VSLKKLLVDRHILDGDQPMPRLVFSNGVDEKRGIAVADAVEESGQVQCERHELVLG
jgi:hypothetical protein